MLIEVEALELAVLLDAQPDESVHELRQREGDRRRVDDGRDGGEQLVTLLLEDGERVRVPLDRIKKAHLVFRWD